MEEKEGNLLDLKMIEHKHKIDLISIILLLSVTVFIAMLLLELHNAFLHMWLVWPAHNKTILLRR